MMIRNELSLHEVIDMLYEYRYIIIATSVVIVVVISSTVYILWSTMIQQQLKFLQKSTFFHHRLFDWNKTNHQQQQQQVTDPFRMIRCTDTTTTTTTTTTSTINRSSVKTSLSSTPTTTQRRIQMLSLNLDFVTYCHQQQQPLPLNQQLSSLTSSSSSQTHWKIMSLGDYISSLRPFFTTTTTNNKNEAASSASSIIPEWLECEIQAALAVALLNSFGPTFGTVLLPALGINLIHTTIRKIASVVSSYVTTSGVENDGTTDYNDENDNHIFQDDGADDDRGSIPLSISTMSTGAEINYQQYQQQQQRKKHKNQNNNNNNNKNINKSPLDLLRMGEVGYPLTFGSDGCSSSSSSSKSKSSSSSSSGTTASSTTTNDHGLPNPFIMSDHWHTTIERMEQRMKQVDESYDPVSFRMQPEPKMIDERFFPDLYIGWGNHVSCTHNQRQILYNRLMATILNRLAYNLHIDIENNNTNNTTNTNTTTVPRQEYFIVHISREGTGITTPCDYIKALIDHGHHMTTCIQTQPTTFGMALCVKESDHTWTNIPFGYFIQTGLSDPKGNESYVCLPHGGLNLEISNGPLFPNHSISIQHYMAIEGLCGWHSNHCANVPWVRSITCHGTVRDNDMVLDSIRIAALQANIINTVGTQYDLPYGGYGLTGVCNDSAAQIECAISQQRKGVTTTATTTTTSSHIYPLTFHGKFAMHTLRVAYELRQTLSNRKSNSNSNNDVVSSTGSTVSSSSSSSMTSTNYYNNNTDIDIECIDRLIQAIVSLPSDTNTAPLSDVINQCERYLHCCHGGRQSLSSDESTTMMKLPPPPPPPPPVFELLVQSRTIVESIQKELIEIQKSQRKLKSNK